MAQIQRNYYEGPELVIGAAPRSTATATEGMGSLTVSTGTTLEIGNAYAINPTGQVVTAIATGTDMRTWQTGIYTGDIQSPEGSGTLVGGSGVTVGASLKQMTACFDNSGSTVTVPGSICYFISGTAVHNATNSERPIAGKVLGFEADGRVIVNLTIRS